MAEVAEIKYSTGTRSVATRPNHQRSAWWSSKNKRKLNVERCGTVSGERTDCRVECSRVELWKAVISDWSSAESAVSGERRDWRGAREPASTSAGEESGCTRGAITRSH